MAFTAQDVKALRDSTGAGMMDCKKALEETDGDIDAAKQYLREKGLAASAKRDDRDNNQGVVALKVDGGVGGDRSAQVRDRLRRRQRAVQGRGRRAGRPRRRQGHRRRCRAGGRARGAQDPAQGEDRARQGGALRGRSRQRDRSLRAHAGWPRRERRAGRARRRQRRAGARHRRAHRLRPPEVPASARTCRPTSSRPSARRSRRSPATRASPKQAVPKIVEGRLNGFFKDVCLLEQPYAKDDKQSIKQVLGSANRPLRPSRNRLIRARSHARCVPPRRSLPRGNSGSWRLASARSDPESDLHHMAAGRCVADLTHS